MTHAPFAVDPSAERMYLPARSGGLNFAVCAASALGVFRLRNLTRIPGAPAHILGVSNTRYGVVAVACLARWLNAGGPATPLGSPALLVQKGGEQFAVAVEEIDEAIAASQEQAGAEPQGSTRSLASQMSGVLRLGFASLPVLDVARLFATPSSHDSQGVAP